MALGGFAVDDDGALVVPVVPDVPLDPAPAEVVVVVPEPGEIRKGAENTLGAVKSF